MSEKLPIAQGVGKACDAFRMETVAHRLRLEGSVGPSAGLEGSVGRCAGLEGIIGQSASLESGLGRSAGREGS